MNIGNAAKAIAAYERTLITPNSPYDYYAKGDMTPEKAKTIPFIYLDCGTEDFLFQNNRDFVSPETGLDAALRVAWWPGRGEAPALPGP